MLTKASAITSEGRTEQRAEVGERAGSTGGLVRTLTIARWACLGLRGPAQAFISGWGVFRTLSWPTFSFSGSATTHAV